MAEKPTLYQAEVYARANAEDVSRPDWENILEMCHAPFAEAFLGVVLYTEDPPLTVREVLDGCLSTDYLIQASDEQKDALVQWLIQNNKLKETDVAEKPKKLTLEDALEERGTLHHNSNMTNLASALLRIQHQRARLDKVEGKIRDLAADPTSSLEDIQKAYEEACKITDPI